MSEADADAERAEFDEGRYLYCVVDPSGADATVEGETDGNATGADSTDADADGFAATGVDDEEAYLIAADGVGVVVHACESVYDTADVGQVKRWLLAHQSVVDAAGEAFGTPIPFRFDTILQGDDDAVEQWLRAESDELAAHLDDLASHWEYRVHLVWDDDHLRETVADDEELAALDERREAAGEGTAFLLEKQYEQRLADLVQTRREAVEASLLDRVEPLAADIERLDRPRASLGDAEVDADGSRVALLLAEERVDDVGAELDEVAATPGVEVQFTGPWPPYTFAPELGGAS